MIILKDIRTGNKPKILSNKTRIYEYSHIVKGARIGKNCSIAQGCYIGAKAIIGDNSRIGNYVSVWDGVVIGKDCFIAPYVVFTNDHDPSRHKEHFLVQTIIGNNTTICANSTLVAPLVIGEEVRIGAGSTVLRDIKSKEEVNWLVKN